MLSKATYSKAFSLIELSVVITIIAILISSFLATMSAEKKLERTTQTYNKINIIYDRIKIFIAQEGRLPCPADPELLESNYGIENCNTSQQIMCSVLSCNNHANTDIYQGSIPIKTLGLDDEFIYDEFGYQFSYIAPVRDSETLDNIFSSWGNNEEEDAIELKNIVDDSTTKKSSLIIISHGENGNGAFYKGVIIDSNINYINDKELKNTSCANCDKSNSDSIRKPNTDFYYGSKTEKFDDIVFSKSKDDLIDLVKSPIKVLMP